MDLAKEFEELKAQLSSIIMVNELYFCNRVKEEGKKLLSNIVLLEPESGYVERKDLIKKEISMLKQQGVGRDEIVEVVISKYTDTKKNAAFKKFSRDLLLEMRNDIYK